MKGLLAGVVIGRFFAGHDVDRDRDHQRTDATAFRPGTQALTRTGHAPTYAHRSHARRSAVRLVALVVVAAIAVGWWSDATSTATTVRLAFWLLVAFGLWAMIEKSRRYSHFREWVVPLSKALGEKLGVRGAYPTDRIHVPADHLTDPDRPSTIVLPEGFNADANARKKLVKLAAERLGLGSAYEGDVDMAGSTPVLTVAVQPAPPDHVGFEAMHEQLEQATDVDLFVGFGRRRRPVWLSWDLDSPHLALSFGSGAGKSTLVRLLAAQTLRQGGRVVIFDVPKEGDSHGDWCRDEDGSLLPGVEMYRDSGSAHDALVAWGAEQRRRSGARWDRTGEDFQRTLVVLEELNATTALLRAHWARTKEKEDPARSPALDELLSLVCTGRSVKINVVAVAQQLTARVFGGAGGEVRENFGLRMLSRFTVNTAKMLIPEITPAPRSSRHRGRIVLAIDGEAVDVQAGYLTEAETIEWATTGAAQTDVRQVVTDPLTRRNAPIDLPHEAGRLTLVPPADEPVDDVSLAAFGEVSGVDLKALRNARDRDPSFPEPVASGPRNVSLYRPSELEAWAAARAQEA